MPEILSTVPKRSLSSVDYHSVVTGLKRRKIEKVERPKPSLRIQDLILVVELQCRKTTKKDGVESSEIVTLATFSSGDSGAWLKGEAVIANGSGSFDAVNPLSSKADALATEGSLLDRWRTKWRKCLQGTLTAEDTELFVPWHRFRWQNAPIRFALRAPFGVDSLFAKISLVRRDDWSSTCLSEVPLSMWDENDFEINFVAEHPGSVALARDAAGSWAHQVIGERANWSATNLCVEAKSSFTPDLPHVGSSAEQGWLQKIRRAFIREQDWTDHDGERLSKIDSFRFSVDSMSVELILCDDSGIFSLREFLSSNDALMLILEGLDWQPKQGFAAVGAGACLPPVSPTANRAVLSDLFVDYVEGPGTLAMHMLDGTDVAKARTVCRTWNQLLRPDNRVIWKQTAQNSLPNTLPLILSHLSREEQDSLDYHCLVSGMKRKRDVREPLYSSLRIEDLTLVVELLRVVSTDHGGAELRSIGVVSCSDCRPWVCNEQVKLEFQRDDKGLVLKGLNPLYQQASSLCRDKEQLRSWKAAWNEFFSPPTGRFRPDSSLDWPDAPIQFGLLSAIGDTETLVARISLVRRDTSQTVRLCEESVISSISYTMKRFELEAKANVGLSYNATGAVACEVIAEQEYCAPSSLAVAIKAAFESTLPQKGSIDEKNWLQEIRKDNMHEIRWTRSDQKAVSEISHFGFYAKTMCRYAQKQQLTVWILNERNLL